MNNLNDVVKQSNNFKNPTVIEDLYLSKYTNSGLIESLISNYIEKIGTNKSETFFRFMNKGLKSPSDEYKLLTSNPPLKNELKSWIEKNVKTEEFGLTINGVSSLDKSLAIDTANFLKNYIEDFGMPLYGFEDVLFCGNYKHSPFGIHTDRVSNVALQFNFGPNERSFVSFEKETYFKIIDHWQEFEPGITALKSQAIAFHPQGYHKVTAQGYSCAITIADSSPSIPSFLNKIGKFLDELFTANNYDFLDLNNILPKEIKIEMQNRNCTFGELAIDIHKYRLKSNGGLQYYPVLYTKNKLEISKEYKAISVFPAQYINISNNTILISRGHGIIIDININLLDKILEEIYKNNFIPNELIIKYESQSGEVEKIINHLYKTDALI